LAVSGNSASFSKLSGDIRSIAFSYFQTKYRVGKLKSKDDAEDLANNVYLTFAEQYHKIESLENWLRRVLFLTFVNWYKRQNKHQVFEFDETYPQNEKSEESASNIDAKKAVSLMNDLKDDKKEILKLRFWEGLKFAEIASKLGKNEVAVKKMFYRTLDELKTQLE